jgi:hypothetical protein
MEGLAWVSIGARSGAVTGVAANGAVFSFRNIGANPILVRRVSVGFVCTTGFTAAQELAWGVTVARAFTASDAAGTPVALIGSNGKLRTSLATLTSVDCRISAATALTAGTKVFDTNPLAVLATYAAAATAGNLLLNVLGNLLSFGADGHPLVLQQNEGFNIQNLVAMGAGGAGVLSVGLEVVETSSFS